MPRKKQRWDDAVGGARWAEEIPPAPGDLRLLQAFVNSAELEARDDLTSPAALSRFLSRWRLLSAGVECRDRGKTGENFQW